jgi:D-alanine-D-alanine ligase
MRPNQSIVMVGDIIESNSSLRDRFWFDHDQPSPEEVATLTSWFNQLGYDVEVVGKVNDFADGDLRSRNAIVFPLWRGGASRNRTAIVPAVCEARQLPYVGGDAFVQTVCQDKSLSKVCARMAGFDVPGEWLVHSVTELSSFRPRG